MPPATPSRLRRLRSQFTRTLLAGVAVAVPFVLTAAALWWLGKTIDTWVRESDWIEAQSKLPPGVGFVVGVLAGVAVFFALGLLTRFYLVRKLVALTEWILLKIPLAKSLYEATRDLMRFFGGAEHGKLGRVVLVTLDNGRFRMLGLLTNEHPKGCGPPPPGEVQRVAVYLPMSYQLGGFTIYVQPDQVQPVDMSVEQAMKTAATADVG